MPTKSGKQVKLAAVYIADRLVFPRNFSKPQNSRFIIESGFKSRAGYVCTRTVYYPIMTLWFAFQLRDQRTLVEVQHDPVNDKRP